MVINLEWATRLRLRQNLRRARWCPAMYALHTRDAGPNLADADDGDELKIASCHCIDCESGGNVEHVVWIDKRDQDRRIEKVARHDS